MRQILLDTQFTIPFEDLDRDVQRIVDVSMEALVPRLNPEHKYRVQVLERALLAMHWQRHKVGAAHWREMGERGERMPVAVALETT